MSLALEVGTMTEVRTGYPYELGAENPFAMPPPVIPECPLCSGKVSRDDPAAQALDWGVRVAQAKEGESGFWRSAEVVHSAMLGVNSDPTSGGDPLHSFVRTAHESAVSLSSLAVSHGGGEPLIGDERREGGASEGRSGKISDQDSGKGQNRLRPGSLDDFGQTKPSLGFPGRKCCEPLKFDYPVPDSVMLVVAEQPKFRFQVQATFNPAGICDCACCAFAQIILKDALVATRSDGTQSVRSSLDPLPGNDRFTGPYQEEEDCVFYKVKDGSFAGAFHADPGSVEEGEGRMDAAEAGARVLGPFCIGDRQPQPHPMAAVVERLAEADPRGTYEDACNYSLTDRPSSNPALLHKKGKEPIEWHWRSEGLIVDICPLHRNEVVSGKSMDVKITSEYINGEYNYGETKVEGTSTSDSDRKKYVKTRNYGGKPRSGNR